MRLRWVAFVLFGGHRALALSCADPDYDVGVSPGATLPANAKPKMLVRRSEPHDAKYSIVCSNEGGPSGPIAIETRDLGGTIVHAVELAPTSPLPEGAACAILHDDEPSTWFRVSSAVDRRAPRVRGAKRARIRVDGFDPYPHVLIPLIGATEDDLVSAVWTSETDAIDYTAPPVTWMYVTSERGLSFTSKGDCTERNFDFPAYGKNLRAGFRLFDPAGNASKPIEVIVGGPPNRWQARQLAMNAVEVTPASAPLQRGSRRGIVLRSILVFVLAAAAVWALRER
jgi:hypothetical protein